MGDSEDEYERRRDKFRGERSEYPVGGQPGRDRRTDGRRGGGRDDWQDRGREWNGNRDRGGGGRRDYVTSNRGDFGGRPRDRYSPPRHDLSPPLKRMRPDWEERRYPYDGVGGGSSSSYPALYSSSYAHEYAHAAPHAGVRGGDEMGPTQPPMMSFKAFMEQCDETISDEDAVRKYSQYKLEFKRQQLNEFFISHKEEEWFKAKYHAEECVKRKEEQIANLKRRIGVFRDLDGTGRLSVNVDADQSHQLLKLLDSVVIKLEGGTDLDLQVLDQPTEEELLMNKSSSGITILSGGDGIVSVSTGAGGDENSDQKPFILTGDSDDDEEKKKEGADPNEKDKPLTEEELQKKAKEYLKAKPSADGAEMPQKKRKRSRSSSSSSSGSSSSSSSDSESEAPPGAEGPTKPTGEEPLPPGMEGEGDVAILPTENGTSTTNGVVSKGAAPDVGTPLTAATEGDGDGEPEVVEEIKPRALHKTASIFLRNLAPTITKAEVEAMCRRYSGFLRAAIADPQPERRWFRRGWVTFRRTVNIKDICWNLNNIQLRDCELGAIVNRDLSRRIRTVNGITSHRGVVRSDIKLAAKIIQNLDSRWLLWHDGETEIEQMTMTLTSSSNPVLRNITDYLIEEASAEEEELLGGGDGGEGVGSDARRDEEDKSEGETIERDETLITVLDRLLLYLRVVHSVDYYNHSEYPNEDEMPNRCGIMHARGIPPSSKVTTQEVQDYCRAFENKIGSFLQPLTKLSDEEAKKLGLKEAEDEVEKFVQSNTQEVAKDKWQCPLCGKKFKAAEFVHKHILHKHAEKVKEVKKEVDYFNNYLRDPKRPQLPEFPTKGLGGPGTMLARKDDLRPDPYVAAYPQQPSVYGYGSYGARYGGGAYGPPPVAPGYGAPAAYPRDAYYGRDAYQQPRDPYQRPRATYRSRVGYRDLDAPKEEY